MDGTAGAGGHAEAILHATAPAGRLVAIDRDADAVEAARRRLEAFGERAILRHADFRQLPLLLDEIGARTVSGILLDLGISSLQLDDPGRGFSFREDGPLDMRMDRSQTATAADLVNTLPEDRLGSILKDFGEEPRARPIARAIVRARGQAPIRTTRSLADLVASVLPRRGPVRIHPATRAFQALRIAVNDELEGLSRLLEQAVGRLEPGGRIVVIAFHSLEDRLVKRTLRGLTRRCVCPRDLPVCASGSGAPDHVASGPSVRLRGARQPAQPQRAPARRGAAGRHSRARRGSCGGTRVSQRAEGLRLQINARLVKEKDRARARELRRLLIYGAAIVVPLLVYVWQRVEFLQVSYRVEALKKERQELQERNKQLTVERSFLTSPDRIEHLARTQLGLIDPPPSDVRRVQVIDGHINEVRAQAGAGDDAGPAPAAAAGRGGQPGRARRTKRTPPEAAPKAAGEDAIEAGIGIVPDLGAATPRRQDAGVKP